MKLSGFDRVEFSAIEWHAYDLIILASGFEERSTHILSSIPKEMADRVLVLGFWGDREQLSRRRNDDCFQSFGSTPFLSPSPLEYDNILKERLWQTRLSIHDSLPMRVFVDYSVMTRSWYAYILTWLKYSSAPGSAEIDFAYSHGKYSGAFEPLRIQEIIAIPGFEGACVGARNTVAAFGLGFDRCAVLAVYEQIEPDSLFCFLAQERPGDEKADRAAEENKEIISIAGGEKIFVPLGNLREIYRILFEEFSRQDPDCEIVAVPMGPKPHVLACLLVAQAIPRTTCLHARGYRHTPVQVLATGVVSIWRLRYGPQ